MFRGASGRSVLAAASVAAVTVKSRTFALAEGRMGPSYKLHLYDHCPFCVRAELVMGRLGIPYERVVYGYGQGAPASSPGYGPSDGPIELTGKKMLPVLEGAGVPTNDPKWAGMPESLDICSFIIATASDTAPNDRKIAPATDRDDVSDWLKRVRSVNSGLTRPRIIRMPVKDWADPRDVAYAQWKYTTKMNFKYDEAMESTSELLLEMQALLQELEGMLRGRGADGEPYLNQWGFSIDDVKVLPILRNLTCVPGLTFPPRVKAYLELGCSKSGVSLYEPTPF